MNAPCSCDTVIEYLAHLGARTAMRMHKQHAARAPTSFSAVDWHLHMAEEDALLFPILARWYPRETGALYHHHDVFRSELRRFGEIRSLDVMAEHSRMEDALVIALLKRGLL